MRVRMVVQMSGLRHDAEPWPGPGNEFDVDDAEGAALVHAGIVVPVEERKAEERPAPADPAVETRAAAPKAVAKEDAAPKASARKA